MGACKMNDEEIVDMFFSRNESAVSEIKVLYGRLIYSVAYGVLRCAEDAEECENEVYMRAWSSIPPARPQSLSAYLCKIARSAALDRYRHDHAAKRGEALPIEELENCIHSDSSAEDRLSERELTALLNRFLKSQDYNTRVIFMRRFWFSDSISEIAKRLHVSESMVKSRISRTLKKLREHLKSEGY